MYIIILTETNDISPAMQAVCEMGIPQEIVKLAVQNHLQAQGTVFKSVEELYQAALVAFGSMKTSAHLSVNEEMFDPASPASKSPDSKTATASHSLEFTCEPVDRGAGQTSAASAAMPEQSKIGEAAESGTTKELQIKFHTLAAENRRLKEKKLCRVCKKVELAVSGITFLPCGHFITCEHCSESQDDCPACGKNIMGTVRTYLS